MNVLNHPSSVYTSRVTRFDVGVAEYEDENGVSCVLLEPRSDRYRELPWAPLDFYYNRGESLAANEELGEADVFFEGDDRNRNGQKDSHLRTVIVDSKRPELKFLMADHDGPRAVFLVGFQKGDLAFEGLLEVVAFRRSGACEAQARVCRTVRKTRKGPECGGTWTPIRQIRAHVDLVGAFVGNPVSRLDASLYLRERWGYHVLASLD